MNRSVLAAASVAVAAAPLAAVAIAKYAARWRPIPIGQVPLDTTGFWVAIQTSGDVVSVIAQTQSRLPIENAMFRASTGAILPRRGRLVGVGEWTWNVRQAEAARDFPRQIVLEDGTGTRLILDVPAASDWPTKNLEGIDLTPGQRAQLVVGDDYLCWSLDAPSDAPTATPDAPRQLKLAHPCYIGHFARDGETILTDRKDGFWRLSTQTGEVVRHTPAPDRGACNWISLTRLGNFLVANSFTPNDDPFAPDSKPTVFDWNVISTRDARLLWTFHLGPHYHNRVHEPVIAPDESVVALPFPDRKHWEVRDLQTGNKLRTLPMVLDTKAAAYSPDGATLYSVADGVLYRQRAR